MNTPKLTPAEELADLLFGKLSDAQLASVLEKSIRVEEISHIRKIQANALRFAADLIESKYHGYYVGDLRNIANQLDSQPPNPPS